MKKLRHCHPMYRNKMITKSSKKN